MQIKTIKKLSLILLITNLFLVACATLEKQQRTNYRFNIEPDNSIAIRDHGSIPVLRVATLNIAHGRKDSVNQLFVWKDTFKQNLDDVADVLNRYKPHVIALQEADEVSLWSGSFDHVTYLAEGAQYPWRAHVSNADSWLYAYGTALLSNMPMLDTIEHSFEPSPPTLNKGFVLARIEWPYGDNGQTRSVDIISVHLDFSRLSVREEQISEMIEVLSARMRPTIIMGDFNSEWLAETSVIKELVKKSRFSTYRPGTTGFNTYKNKRLDWILITKELEFVDYQVLPDTLSDHAMIVADIRFKKGAGG